MLLVLLLSANHCFLDSLFGSAKETVIRGIMSVFLAAMRAGVFPLSKLGLDMVTFRFPDFHKASLRVQTEGEQRTIVVSNLRFLVEGRKPVGDKAQNFVKGVIERLTIELGAKETSVVGVLQSLKTLKVVLVRDSFDALFDLPFLSDGLDRKASDMIKAFVKRSFESDSQSIAGPVPQKRRSTLSKLKGILG